MFYEEKIINGILMFRSTHNEEWQQCSIERMSEKIERLTNLLNESDGERTSIKEDAYLAGKTYEKQRITELLGLTT